MKILVTNDDGYLSPGLQVLVKVMKKFGEVTVIAPKRPQSAVSLAVTMGYQPIAVKELGYIDGARWFYLDGTPASCVKFGIDNVFLDGKPDFVVSGVNHGANTSTAACYSATLGAAAEASINRMPGIGVSFDSHNEDADLSAVEAILPGLVRKIFGLFDGRFGEYFNVNFPNIPLEKIKGVRVCHMSRGHWEKEFESWNPEAISAKGVDLARYGIDPDKVVPEEGEELYYMTGHFIDDSQDEVGADNLTMHDGYVTIVKHNADNTDYASLDRLKESGLEEDWR